MATHVSLKQLQVVNIQNTASQHIEGKEVVMPSTSFFDITEHTTPACHIREYPRATISGEDEELQLAVKQYVPKQTFQAHSTITVIGAHANGFPKELYEPLWDDLYEKLKAKGIAISSIWAADVAHQGASGVYNEDLIGNDPSWNDHPRDLFLMINAFRQHMKRPLVGVGHSMGGNNLINLSIMHPRLLTSLILLDPVVQRYPNAEGNYGPARASVNRRDVWSSREEAGTKLMRSKFYQAWDPRVLDKWLKYGLRDLPTRLHPEVPTSSVFPSPSVGSESSIARPAEHDGPITLTTTKHQEVLTFGRANIPTEEYPDPAHRPNPDTHPDVDSSAQPNAPFYAPVPIATFGRLPNLRPSVFYVFGSESNLSAPVLKADKLANTGVGVGGSGGVQAGRVADVTFEGVGHLIPMEVVGRTAEVCADWLEPELKRWNQLETTAQKAWAAVPIEEKSKFGHQYEDALKDYWDKEVVARKQDTKL